MRHTAHAFLLALSATLIACGGDPAASVPPGPPPPSPPPPPPTPVIGDTLLMGDPDRPALAALIDRAPATVPESDIVDGLILTRLQAMVRADAPAGTVNAALLAAGARVDGSTAGLPILSLRIPRVADLAAARAVAAGLVASRAFWLAAPARQAAIDVLPILPPSGDTGISHLVPSRLPAAWNVRNLATATQRALVPDFFHHTNPVAAIGPLTFRPATAGRPSAGSNHGFHVAGILAADHDVSAFTGVFPHPSRIVVDGLPLAGAPNTRYLIRSHLPAAGSFVLSTSLNFPWDPTPAGRLELVFAALEWRLLMMPHTGRFLHLTSAGNRGAAAAPANQAVWNSEFTVAARHDDLRPLLRGIGLPARDSADFESAWQWVLDSLPSAAVRSPNVLLVGSSNRAGAESAFSSRGADVRAVGDLVYAPCVIRDPDYDADPTGCDGSAARYSGTSMSTPLVAGIAAYLWSLDPGLTPLQLRARLREAYDLSPLAGVLDAYHAVLRLDDGVAGARIRGELLDAAPGPGGSGNGRFDEDDVEAFLEAFGGYAAARTSAGTPDAPDYSRFDLNGNGLTGDSGRRVPFDLNANGVIDTHTRTIEGAEVTFDESLMSDFRTLCYYAWSSLYQGDIDARRDALPGCVPAEPPPPDPNPVPEGSLDSENNRAQFFFPGVTPPPGPCNADDSFTGAPPLEFSSTTFCGMNGASLTATRVVNDRGTGTARSAVRLTGSFASNESGTFSGNAGTRSTHYIRIAAPGFTPDDTGSVRPVVRIKLSVLVPAVPTSCTGGHLASADAGIRLDYVNWLGGVQVERSLRVRRGCGSPGSTTEAREETVTLPPIGFSFGQPVPLGFSFGASLHVLTNGGVNGHAEVEYRILSLLGLPAGASVETYGGVTWPEPPTAVPPASVITPAARPRP